MLESAETTFQQDLNGDGLIGIPTVVIESSGSTSLTQVGSNYYLYNSGVGPQLQYLGAAVVAGQISGWAPIAAEQISGGYQVVWKANGADQYTLWTTDSSGKFVSYIPAMSGSSSVLESAETTFQQDLNGDGLIGVNSARLPPTGASALNSDIVSQANAVAAVANDTFVFGSNLKPGTIASIPGTAALDEFPSTGSELVKLLQDAHSQQAAFQWTSQFDALSNLADVVPTKVEIAGLHTAGFIFH